MVKSLIAWFKGLFGGAKASAQGLYNDPTAVQVERLIAAAKGEEYRPPEKASLYSKPTYAQFERLIEAIKALDKVQPEDLANFFDGAEYNARYGTPPKPYILLKHGEEVIARVPADDFVIDGMVDDVYLGTTTSGPEDFRDESGYLVIKFNADASNKVIRIPLTSVFNPDDYQPRLTFDKTPTADSQNPVTSGGVRAAIDGKRDKLDLAIYEESVTEEYWRTVVDGAEVTIPLVSRSGTESVYQSGEASGSFQVQVSRAVGGTFGVTVRRYESGGWAAVVTEPETAYSEITHVEQTQGGNLAFDYVRKTAVGYGMNRPTTGNFGISAWRCSAAGASAAGAELRYFWDAARARWVLPGEDSAYITGYCSNGAYYFTAFYGGNVVGMWTGLDAEAGGFQWTAVTLAFLGDVPRVVAPSQSADEGAAAGAKATGEALEGKADKAAPSAAGNIAEFDEHGNPVDSGKSLDDISQEIQDAIQYAVVVDDKLVPTEGPGTSVIIENGPNGGAVRYLAGHLPAWTCNATYQSAVERNHGASEKNYHYDPSLFPDRIVFWVEGKNGGEHGLFTRSIVFPKAGVYTLDIEYAAGYESYPDTMGQARFVVDAGTSGPQDIVGIDDPSIVQHAQVQFAASAGAGSITIKGKTGLSGNACCVVIASVKVTLVKEIGIEIGDIVAPDADAQTGQAADAKATYRVLNQITNIFSGVVISLEPTQNEVNELMKKLVGELGGSVGQ